MQAARRPALLLLAALSGCQCGYVWKQGLRQISLACRQVPLESDEARANLPLPAVEKLRWIPRILAFAEEELGLDSGDSYRTFLDMKGQPVSHVVTAAAPLAMVPFEWRFPFVDRVPYKGFFDLEDAQAEERRLRQRGFDTALFPVHAFSSLGWFRDPILSTMLERDLASLVELIFHETTHRTLFFPGHASFNESLATHVAYEGTLRFLDAHEELRSFLPAYEAEEAASRRFQVLLRRLRDDLEALYRSPLSAARKEARKAEMFSTASLAYREIAPAARAASIPPSNAFLLAAGGYHQVRPLLTRVQQTRGGHPRHLVAYLKRLSSHEDPLAALAAGGETENTSGDP